MIKGIVLFYALIFDINKKHPQFVLCHQTSAKTEAM